MNNKKIVFVVLSVLLFSISLLAGSYVKSGTMILEDLDLNYEAFDFDTGKVLKSTSEQVFKKKIMLGDFSWDKYDTGVAILTTDQVWKCVKDLGKKNINDVKSVTIDGFKYKEEIVFGHVYCVRTKQFNYGLVRFVGYQNNKTKISFEWKFNYNGGVTF